MEKELHYPLFYRRDLTAFWALFADNLANIVILSGICLFVFNMPEQIVFGRILPGLGVSLLVGLSFYVYLARRLARKEQRNDVTALPYGISTPVMFVYLFGIIGPVYWGLKASDNKYPVRTCQIMDGAGTMVGAFFGSAFPTTVYIGHPAYKRLKGRCGYALGVGIVLFLGAIFGFVHFLYNLIPEAAVAPMLVFVGLVITAQAFSASPTKHSLAVAVAIIPHISNILSTKIRSAVSIANAEMNVDSIEFAEKCTQQGIAWIGQSALSQGAIITGLLWGSILAMLIDLDFKKAASFSGAAAFLTLIGVVHSPNLGLHFTTIFWGYLMMTALFVAAWLGKIEKDPEIGEFEFKGN